MINILLVDDNERKANLVRAVLEQVPLGEIGRCDVEANVYAACGRMAQVRYDLLVLDLNIPLRHGEDPKGDGGLRVWEHLRSNPKLHRPTFLVGLTAYPDLATRYEKEFADDGWFTVVFDETSTEWERLLGRKLVHIAEIKSGLRDELYDCDLAIITALYKPEMEAVLELRGEWNRDSVPGDDTVYYRGRFRRGTAKVEVVACCADEMGMPTSTAVSMKVIAHYRPRYIAMVGIAAGVKGNVGDILVADQTWDYGSGKSKYKYLWNLRMLKMMGRIAFEPAPTPILLAPIVKAKLGCCGMRKNEILKSISERWNGAAPASSIALQMGPLASGAAVVENRPLVEEIKSHNRKLIGIEMEAYGVFVAARLSCAPRPCAMAIKSICDYGDQFKSHGDKWQRYAAFTSAQYLYEFALDQLAN